MKLMNIYWQPDIKVEVERALENAAEIEEKLNIEGFSDMEYDEQYNRLIDVFHHTPAVLDDLLELPSEVELPREFTEEDAVEYAWEWLENEYGTAVEGFEIHFDDGTVVKKG